ncbi:HIT family protein [Ornithinimicrobium cerasi]|uniref:HIT family protein n=1 Tax=Ornithinimicrobium cerasi TaxID=2248773 RepID=UPI000F0004CC|nr:HIT family protein [Ornithinimicrobium cerasi]
MATLFSKIIDGQIPGQVVWSDDVCAAFLDLEPLTPGHALVVPRAEVDHWIDLDTATVSHLLDVAARLGRAQLEAFGGERVGLIVQGFEVPHAHVHVFAARGPGDFDLAARSRRSPEELAADAEALRAALGPVAG